MDSFLRIAVSCAFLLQALAYNWQGENKFTFTLMAYIDCRNGSASDHFTIIHLFFFYFSTTLFSKNGRIV